METIGMIGNLRGRAEGHIERTATLKKTTEKEVAEAIIKFNRKRAFGKMD
jgi:hypothetical protein